MKKSIFTGIIIILVVVLLIVLAIYAFQNSNIEESDKSIDDNSGKFNSVEVQQNIDTYIENNIGELSPEEPVLGGSFYVTSIEYPSNSSAIVDYEDGHQALKAELDFEIHENNDVEIKSFEIIDKNLLEDISESSLPDDSSDILEPSLSDDTDDTFEVDLATSKEVVGSYIENNIETLSPESPEAQSNFFVSTIEYPNANTAIVEYEDGFTVLTAEVDYELDENYEVKIVSFNIINSEKISTESGNEDTDEGCEDLCGDGVCQDVVCTDTGCPCQETTQSCPADCS